MEHQSGGKIGRTRAPVGGLEIGLNPKQIGGYEVSENLNKNTFGWGMIFLHEFEHTKVGGSKEDPHSFGTPGDVEEDMNIIREELGEDYGKRESYQPLELYDGYKYFPFNSRAEEDIEKNIIPSTFVKYK